MNEKRFARAGALLLKWHEETERDLPWRGERDPYRIWLSETMLQQTRAAHAAGRYVAFCHRFPNVFSLAAAPEEDVLALWQGMGYYARARNLRKAAIALIERYQGAFPQTEEALVSLPGIGRYTARAILSMGYNQPVAAIDANLERVISRYTAMRGFVEDNRDAIREIGDCWLRVCATDRPGDFNRALMGLGALVCLPRAPKCAECPIRFDCEALSEGAQAVLPEKRPKPKKKEEERGLALVISKGAALVRKRSDKGMLASLWEFPHSLLSGSNLPKSALAAEILSAAREEGFEFRLLPGEPTETRFVFTHRIWHIRALCFAFASPCELEPPYRLADAAELRSLAMPSVMEPYRALALSLLEE